MISHGKDIKIFTGNAYPKAAEDIAKNLGLPLGKCAVGHFADGEVSVSPEETVRGSDVFIVQSTCNPVNDNLMELIIMIDAFRRASAGNALAAAFLAAGGAVLSRSGAGAAAGIGAAAAQKRDMPIRMELRRLRPALRAPCRGQQERRQKRRAKQHAAAPAKDPVFKKFLHRCSREAFPAETAAARSFSKVRCRGGSQVQA